jgi:DNA-binding CsgD family transcriptional regulator
MTAVPHQSFLCPTIIGRETELDALRAFLSEDGGVLLVSGEAGVGKSRLVREARSLAVASSLRVLEGQSFEADRAHPFAPALDLLRGLADRRGIEEIARVAGPGVVELGRLLPELAPGTSLSEPDDRDLETAKRRLFEAFGRLLTRLGDGSPLLLVMEDIHWPDSSSLELMLYLARRAKRERWHMLLTYRSDEVHPDLEHVLATLDRERLANELRLSPFDAARVAAMLQAIFAVDAPVPADLLHTIVTLTEGNPFFIEEIVATLATERPFLTPNGAWARGAIHHLHIPRSVHDAVRQRLTPLSDAARDALTLAAVAGRQFEFDLLRALAGHGEEALLALMKELIAAQLVVEDSGDRFVFRHALMREAIRAGLLDRERRRLHRRIAEAIARGLAGSPENRLDDLSTHAFAAGSWAQALDVAQRAGIRAAALHAPRTAVEHFSRAIDAGRALGRPPSAELHRQRGHAYETLGEFERALGDFDRALTLARASSDLHGEWQTLLDLGLLWASRDYRESGRHIKEALAVARKLDDPATIARALNRLGNWHANVEQHAEASRLHREALAIFETLHDDRGIAETLDLLGITSLLGADLGGCAAAYRRAEGLWRDLGDRRGLASALIGLTCQGPMFHTDTLPPRLPVSEVRETGMEGIAICREIDWRAGECYALWGFLGMTPGACGEYDVALPGTRRALQIAREIGHQQWVTGTRCILGNIFADLGDFASARTELETALVLARQIDSLYWVRSAAGWLASTLVRSGEIDAAAAVLANDLSDATPMDATAGRQLWCAAAELALAQGYPSRALDIAMRLEASAPGMDRRPAARLEKLRGDALAALGRYDEASAALSVAREEATWSGARPLLWRIETARGRLHQGQDQLDEAAIAFDAARAIVADLAASVPEDTLRETFLDLIRREIPLALAQSALEPSPIELSPLTKREREIAALLTQGLTNRAIGERLFVSEWTVATHVRNILAKLDLGSRTQIAAWAASQGLRRDA